MSPHSASRQASGRGTFVPVPSSGSAGGAAQMIAALQAQNGSDYRTKHCKRCRIVGVAPQDSQASAESGGLDAAAKAAAKAAKAAEKAAKEAAKAERVSP